MGDHSKIEWTDATWNPVRGCSRVSAGCEHCYAEGVAARFSGVGQPYEGLIHRTTRGWNGNIKLVPEALDQPLRWKRPRRVFVNSMSDLFHENVPDGFILQVFAIMESARQHTFQVLTKRPERMLQFVRVASQPTRSAGINMLGSRYNGGLCWPPPNVWLGVSVEDQAAADERIPMLLRTPAAVRFLSCEPLLGRVDLCEHLGMWWNQTMQCFEGTGAVINRNRDGRPGIGWVIAGGESGHGARPMHPDWVRSLRDQCKAAGVPFFFKQWGEWVPSDYFDADTKARLISFKSDKRETLLGEPGKPHTFQNMKRVGKKQAGHLLDGVEHHGFPEQRA